MAALVIDAFQFSRQTQSRDGEVLVSDLARLSQDTADRSGILHWSVAGEANPAGYPQLRLSVSGTVQLMCQRCLHPFAFDIASESILILARDEARADEIEAMLDDDTIDVIVGSSQLNLVDLIEDEALLAIPGSPRHDACPDMLKF